MKGLKTLIRLTKNKLDACRRVLVELLESEEAVRSTIKSLEDELEEGRIQASKTDVPYAFAGAFEEKMAQRIQFANSQLQTVLKEIDRQRDLIQDVFQELKRYETALKHRIEQESLEEKKVEQAFLDEIAGRLFYHKKPPKDFSKKGR